MNEEIDVGTNKDEPHVNEYALEADDDIVGEVGQDILIEDV